jgi:hypothetical protein
MKETKLYRVQDRLMQLINYGIEVHRNEKASIVGENTAVYDNGEEYVVGTKNVKFQTPDDGPSAKTVYYKMLIDEVGLTKADEILKEGRIKTQIEHRVLVLYAQNGRNIYYTYDLPSRFFMRRVNPNFPRPYREKTVDDYLTDEEPQEELAPVRKRGSTSKTTRRKS